MAKAHCKCKPAACEECPEWIFTFADLVMLMMGFFVFDRLRDTLAEAI